MAQSVPDTAVSALSSYMVEAPEMEVSASPAPPSQQQGDSNTDCFAQAVAVLLTPTIAASVEKAVNAGMIQI